MTPFLFVGFLALKVAVIATAILLTLCGRATRYFSMTASRKSGRPHALDLTDAVG